MAEVTCDEFEVVKHGCRRDLQVSVREDVPAPLQIGPDHAKDAGDGEVVGEDRHGRKHTGLDVLQMAFFGGRAIGALEEFTDGHGTCELVLPRDGLEPLYVGLEGSGTQQLRDRVRIEKVGHGDQSRAGEVRLPILEDVSRM